MKKAIPYVLANFAALAMGYCIVIATKADGIFDGSIVFYCAVLVGFCNALAYIIAQ